MKAARPLFFAHRNRPIPENRYRRRQHIRRNDDGTIDLRNLPTPTQELLFRATKYDIELFPIHLEIGLILGYSEKELLHA